MDTVCSYLHVDDLFEFSKVYNNTYCIITALSNNESAYALQYALVLYPNNELIWKQQWSSLQICTAIKYFIYYDNVQLLERLFKMDTVDYITAREMITDICKNHCYNSLKVFLDIYAPVPKADFEHMYQLILNSPKGHIHLKRQCLRLLWDRNKVCKAYRQFNGF